MPASREWSESPIPDTIRPGHDTEKLDALQSAVMGAQSSLVSKALRMLRRSSPLREGLCSPLGNRIAPRGDVRPPELATLDTPPSSCVISMDDEINDPLLKPPTVPSQIKRAESELEPFEEALKPIAAETSASGENAGGPLCVGISTEWFLGHSERPELYQPPSAIDPSQKAFVEIDSFPSVLHPSGTQGYELGSFLNGSYDPISVKYENNDTGLYGLTKLDSTYNSSTYGIGHVGSHGTMNDLSQPTSISDASVASEDWSSIIDLTGVGDTPMACDGFRTTPSPPLQNFPLVQGAQPFNGGVEYQGFEQGDDCRMVPFRHPEMYSSTLDPFKVSLYHDSSNTVPPATIVPKLHVGVLNNIAPKTPMETSTELYACDVTSCTQECPSIHELHSHHKAVHFPSTFRVPSPHINTTAPLLAQPPNPPLSRPPTTGVAAAAPPLPLKCNISGCAKIFSSMHNLNEHKQVHMSPRIRGYHCGVPNCGGNYFYKRDLQRHMRKKHPALVARLESCRVSRVKAKVGAKARLVRM
ncbi:uncharacterized protein UTRI_01815 [Ustilago trichophora]|uniref:C2H2-type domain-containing protein n=1 Tax=Ustilago trichophora TaxID=86804 RepID=A0A5C3E0Q6_9BASI|nr:uncharacterized protein UTRI_01815 [Ustilago trichophora]